MLANPAASWLRFNLSHSGEVMLLAFSRQHPVGVDIEQIHSSG